MKYFAEYVFNHIKTQTEKSIHEDNKEKKLLIVMPSFPPAVACYIGLKIEEYCFKSKTFKIPIIKIAKDLFSEWESSDNVNIQDYSEKIKRNEWNDEKGNLTSYRNITNGEDKLLLILLIGIDKVTDSSSLADFYHCDFNTIWDDLGHCFKPWIKEKLEESIVGFEEEEVNNFDNILKAIKNKCLADILQISEFLENLNLTNAQDGKDALHILMHSLDFFELPLFNGYDFVSSKPFEYYIEKAMAFFSYSEFFEENNRKKAVKTIDDFIEKEHDYIDTHIPKEFYQPFNNITEFIEGLKEYINNDDNKQKDKLKKCDFVTIDKLIKYKKKDKPKSDEKEKIKKISSNPIEMVLTAIWNTFSEYDAKNYEDIKEIRIKTSLFKHDCVGNSAKERNNNAEKYVYRLLGGVDDLVNDWIILKKGGIGNNTIVISSELLNDKIIYNAAGNGEPSLKFTVTIVSEDEESSVSKVFAWRLPEMHPYRISNELIQWAAQKIEARQDCCLPVFPVLYLDEMMLAKDEEETRRVLMQSIGEEKSKVINLLDGLCHITNINNDSVAALSKLANRYGKYLIEASQKGLHSFFINGFDDLRQIYEQAFDWFLNSNKYAEDPLRSLLFRSFFIIRDRKEIDYKNWIWEPYEQAGIVTVLHPALLEILRDQIFYLFASFSYLVSSKIKEAGANRFNEKSWQSYIDLAKIQAPICGIISDSEMKLDTNAKGNDLVYRIGRISESEAALTTKMLLKYDDFEEEDISDAELFKETRESNIYLNILKDYRELHLQANDALSIAVYQNSEIQPIIAAIDRFLKDIFSDKDKLQRKYVLTVTIFSESGDDTNISQWINQWKECWETSEIPNSLSHYLNTLISISHRIVDSKDNYKQFRNIVTESFEVDLVFLSNFISAGEQGNEFRKVEPYDIRRHTLKFPMLEKAFCGIQFPSKELERTRILSNRQFSLSTRFSELMACIKYKNLLSGKSYTVLGRGDYSQWQSVIDNLHQHAEWIVCVDPVIDENLIQKKEKEEDKKREIIGFGSGVGSHGENNYTISTELFDFSDVMRGLDESIKEVYSYWENSSKEVAKSILDESKNLSGLSLIKATGKSQYIRDFMANSLTRKLLKVDRHEDVLCDKLVSLDAYTHWFENAEYKYRPDLLWIVVRMGDAKKIHLECKLIECKLAKASQEHSTKAIIQLKNGLNQLIPLFKPRKKDLLGDEDNRPDQRYWWLQIHRLISSRTQIEHNQDIEKVLTALERLSDGDYSIDWQAAAVCYWTDLKNDSITITDKERFIFEGKELNINSIAIGSDFVYSICTSGKHETIPWDKDSIRFDSSSVETGIDEGDKKIIETELEKVPIIDTDVKPSPEEALEPEPPIVDTELREKEKESEEELAPESEIIIHPKISMISEIPDRILLGEAINGQKPVYWEYGHRQLSNRHIIILGTSGMGKTYAIQCLLRELGKKNNNSLIVDYTNGFSTNQLEPETKELLSPIQHIIQQSPLNINPFRRQIYDIDAEDPFESTVTTAQRISSVFSEVYQLGGQQKSALYQAIKTWLELNDGKVMGLKDLIPRLKKLEAEKGVVGSSASSVISKIQPFVDQNPFGTEDEEGWDKIYNDLKNHCHIIQLSGFLKDSSKLITEFLLIDLYWYYRWKGNQDNPRVVVLDEVQNLDHKKESPIAYLLTEGRKFGFSLILATQILSNLDKDEKDRLFNAAHKLFFKPVDTEVKTYAEIASIITKEKIEDWSRRLLDLKKGQCISLGPSLNEATGELVSKAFSINITSLEDR